MNEEENTNEPGILLGVVIILFILGYNLIPMTFVDTEASGLIVTGIYIYIIGTLFLVSYYYSYKSFFFRAMIWVCEYLSWPSTKKMAFFYFWLAVLCGTAAVVQGVLKIDSL